MELPLPIWLKETLERDVAAAERDAYDTRNKITKFVTRLAAADNMVTEDVPVKGVSAKRLLHADGHDLQNLLDSHARAHKRIARGNFALELDREARNA